MAQKDAGFPGLHVGSGGGKGIDCCSGSEWEEEEARKGGGASEGAYSQQSERFLCVLLLGFHYFSNCSYSYNDHLFL